MLFDIIIIAFAIQVWVKVKQDLPPADHTIMITAQQWGWVFSYPGEDGDFAAMHLHSPTITYLRPGKIEVIDENSNLVSAFFTGSGFVKLNQNSCIIMTDYIKKLEDIKKSSPFSL